MFVAEKVLRLVISLTANMPLFAEYARFNQSTKAQHQRVVFAYQMLGFRLG